MELGIGAHVFAEDSGSGVLMEHRHTWYYHDVGF